MALTNGKFKGKSLSLTINSVEYNMDCTSIEFVSEDADADELTFAEIGSTGGKDWFMDVAAIQEFATGSLWRYVWDNAGDEDIAFLAKPYGNATATATQPHFSGTLTIPSAPNFGGEADATFTFEVRFELDAQPTMVVA